MFASLLAATAATLAPGAAGQARHRQRHPPPRHRRARPDRRRLPRLGARLRRRHLRPDLPRRVGRPANAPGSPGTTVRPPAVAVAVVLLAQPGRGDHLPADQRCRGARSAGGGRHRDAVRVRADADRSGRDPRGDGRAPGAADVPGAAAAAPGRDRVPHRLGRRLPVDPGEDRRDHRLPPGIALRRAGRAGLRPGAAPHRPLRRAQHRESRRELQDRGAERGVLPRRRDALGAGHGGDPRHRRDRGDQRSHLDRRRLRVHRRAEQLLRPHPAALAAVHDLSVRDGGAGQDLRPARRAARARRRSGRGGARAGARRGPLRRRLVSLRAIPGPGRCATSTSPFRPGRPSRWSGPPGPASRRSPSSSPASTTRWRAGC